MVILVVENNCSGQPTWDWPLEYIVCEGNKPMPINSAYFRQSKSILPFNLTNSRRLLTDQIWIWLIFWEFCSLFRGENIIRIYCIKTLFRLIRDLVIVIEYTIIRSNKQRYYSLDW